MKLNSLLYCGYEKSFSGRDFRSSDKNNVDFQRKIFISRSFISTKSHTYPEERDFDVPGVEDVPTTMGNSILVSPTAKWYTPRNV